MVAKVSWGESGEKVWKECQHLHSPEASRAGPGRAAVGAAVLDRVERPGMWAGGRVHIAGPEGLVSG